MGLKPWPNKFRDRPPPKHQLDPRVDREAEMAERRIKYLRDRRRDAEIDRIRAESDTVERQQEFDDLGGTGERQIIHEKKLGQLVLTEAEQQQREREERAVELDFSEPVPKTSFMERWGRPPCRYNPERNRDAQKIKEWQAVAEDAIAAGFPVQRCSAGKPYKMPPRYLRVKPTPGWAADRASAMHSLFLISKCGWVLSDERSEPPYCRTEPPCRPLPSQTGHGAWSAAIMPRVAAIKRKRDRATELLRSLLRGCGSATTREIKQYAVTHGIRWRTIERAASELGVEKSPGGFQGHWVWRLPDVPQNGAHAG